MNDENDDRYLWDGTGQPDPEVVRLEQTLGRLRHDGAPPVFPKRATTTPEAYGRHPRRAGGQPRPLCIRDLAVHRPAAILMGRCSHCRRTRYRRASGHEHWSSRDRPDGSRRMAGRARACALGHIGQVDVDPNTRVQLLQARSREHRLSLERGTIHARIWAPPRFFFVNTPAATAIDLGCAYTLHVDADGSGQLRVTHGWVGFERDGREAFIPQGAMCATRRASGPARHATRMPPQDMESADGARLRAGR